MLECCAAGDWPGFHGLEHQGVAPQAGSAVTWTSQVQTDWQVTIPGKGFSSPVVLGDRVYLTTAYETDKGKTSRAITAKLNYVLAWVLLMLTALTALRNATEQTDLAGLAITTLLTTAVLFITGISALGAGLFSLDGSILRSWKMGVLVSFASLSAAWLASKRVGLASIAFATASTLLSVFAYLHMPNRENFFGFGSSGGAISTMIVVGPALAGWGLSLIMQILHTWLSQAPSNPPVSHSPRILRVVITLVLPVLLTSAAFGILAARVPGTAAASLMPSSGWLPFFVLCVATVLAVFVGHRARVLSPRLPRLALGVILVSCLLAIGSFLRFAAFPSQRQVAHAIVAVATPTGKLDWIREVALGLTLHDFKGVNSRATPTLAASSEGMAAFFGPLGLFGLSLDGKRRWHSNAVSFDTEFGVGHSPVTADGVVVLANERAQAQGPPGQSNISAYDIDGGQLLWRRERPRTDSRSAGYSTPIIRRISGRQVVLMRGWDDLAAYDLHSGTVVWTSPLKHRGNHLVASVVIDDKRAYVLDATRALALDLQRLAQPGDPVAWLVPIPGEKAASPVVIDDLLFVATETGLAVCIDAATGKVLWREKLGKRFFSSVIAHGNAIVFADETGELSLVKRGRAFELIAQIKLNENIYATPVPQTDGLLVRGVTNLFHLSPERGPG